MHTPKAGVSAQVKRRPNNRTHHPPSSSFMSLLKVHHQSKILSQTIKEFLVSQKDVSINGDVDEPHIESLTNQLTEFVEQSTSILLVFTEDAVCKEEEEDDEKEEDQHMTSRRNVPAADHNRVSDGVGGDSISTSPSRQINTRGPYCHDDSSIRRFENTGNKTVAFQKTKSPYGIVHRSGRRAISPTHRQTHYTPKRRVIAMEVIYTLILSLQAFPFTHHMDIHRVIWPVIVAITLQQNQFYSSLLQHNIPNNNNIWDRDWHFTLLHSLRRFTNQFSTTGVPELILHEEHLHFILTYCTLYIQQIIDNPREITSKENVSLAYACLIHCILTITSLGILPSSSSSSKKKTISKFPCILPGIYYFTFTTTSYLNYSTKC